MIPPLRVTRSCGNTTMRERVMIWGLVWLGLSFLAGTTLNAGQAAPDPDDPTPVKSRAERKASLRMTPGIVCSAIDGYEDYKILPKAAQTSDEKLLVYFRPLGYQSERVDDA